MPIRSLLVALHAAVLYGLLGPASALAADGERTPLDLGGGSSRAAQEAGPGGGGLVRTIVGLAIVIGVIYGIHWVLKQVKASRESAATGTGLQTISTLPLGPNRSLHLVRAGDEVVLLGAGEGGVSAIRTYPEHEARALGLLDEGAPAAQAPTGSKKPPQLGRMLAALRRRTVIR